MMDPAGWDAELQSDVELGMLPEQGTGSLPSCSIPKLCGSLLEGCDMENGELTAEIAESLSSQLEERDRRISKLTAELGERDARIKERDRKTTRLAAEVRRLTALLGDRDSRLRKLTAELTKCDATIRIFTVELGEQHTKIGELTADIKECGRKLRKCLPVIHLELCPYGKGSAPIPALPPLFAGKQAAELEERDLIIWENEAEIRRLRELLGFPDHRSHRNRAEDDINPDPFPLAESQDSGMHGSPNELEDRDLERELEDRDRHIGEITEELEELTLELETRERRIEELTAELEEYKAKARRCLQEHRKEEETMAQVTLDPSSAHPRLVLSPDHRSVRWEFHLDPPPDIPERFDSDPCVLGCESFSSGRHCWDVDVSQGQFCAVGITRASVRRKGSITFSPEQGIWALQQWGFQSRVLASPPLVLRLARVPRRIRVSLDYEGGEVKFWDVENQVPIFTFPSASFHGERLRPWFWLELGSISLR
ncbi:E3 ubiquitin-protein ligase TRIM58-like isoform X3 [Melopsittacus undulatus]|uniref:E3 ubiquitin-protein ligase TRIM58-like isoform X3 n=1 Tax=Melopsittacus undulatus TaxID=13146 RepID=UPI00146CF722|nr:E3 ubiquitin-protein ligase TRIM58-like isoform X3 [Melopsittacus undulatus]